MPDDAGEIILDHLVDTFEAARLLGTTPAMMRQLRCYGGGPCYIKLGRSVRYSIRDIEMHKAKNRVASTSEHWRAA
ncbi:helix-turn-helix transcriptional regulator [Sphingomonas adhaesiva]|uniref:DNA-binding protein n=1 Tax=Sphingomonas adhaesiva TaxID=28212 RepID=A0A2A4I9V0_9SPHN|nr:DNA-binding protein [Sphingomonas adhaesiva]PCG15747.1 DNA-binding protein [Sphingomonas adhaesiva]